MQRAKRSKVWLIPTNELRQEVSVSSSYKDLATRFDLSCSGGTRAALFSRLELENICCEHIKRGLNSNSGRTFKMRGFKLEDVLVANSSYKTGNLKVKLLKHGLLENKCKICGIGPEWNGKPLTLALDHENGINNDHRLSNIRLLCPNCHSQTPTFAGRNIKKK